MEKSTYEDVRYEVDGPVRVGSFDGGFGSAYLARVVGEKRLGVTEASLHVYFARRANGQQLDQKRYIRPETLARLDPAARFVLDV